MLYKPEWMLSSAFQTFQIVYSGVLCREGYSRSSLVSSSFRGLVLGFSWMVGIAIGSGLDGLYSPLAAQERHFSLSIAVDRSLAYSPLPPQQKPFQTAQLTIEQQTTAQQVCPDEVELLTELLIRDLPSYANRQLRSVIPLDSTLSPSRVIIAGRPEFAPLPLAPGQPAPSQDADPAQVFISTLERQYVKDRALEIQQYHWLFLTRSPSGWRLAFMFTRTGSATPGTSPTPPRDSSDGAIAQAIKTWLRDCRAGLVNVMHP